MPVITLPLPLVAAWIVVEGRKTDRSSESFLVRSNFKLNEAQDLSKHTSLGVN
jgi:hypothetical protein